MRKREFHSIGELEQVKGQLARASQRPVFIDTEQEYRQPDRNTPLYEEVDTDSTVRVNNKSALWNERDNQIEYISSDEYELVQHDEILDLVQESVGRTAGEIDMGVIRDYGAQIDGTLVFSNIDEASINVEEVIDMDGYIPPEGDVDPQGNARARDTVGLGMRIGNSFDGSKKVSASTMGYRFICQNWLVWGEEEIAATQQGHVDEIGPDFFDEVIGEVFDIKEEVSKRIHDAEREEIPMEWVPELLDEVGFGPTYQKRITGRVLTQRTRRDGETTSWRLYNAATNFLDNDRAETIGKGSYDGHQDRAWQLLDEPSSPAETWDMEEVREFAIID